MTAYAYRYRSRFGDHSSYNRRGMNWVFGTQVCTWQHRAGTSPGAVGGCCGFPVGSVSSLHVPPASLFLDELRSPVQWGWPLSSTQPKTTFALPWVGAQATNAYSRGKW